MAGKRGIKKELTNGKRRSLYYDHTYGRYN